MESHEKEPVVTPEPATIQPANESATQPKSNKTVSLPTNVIMIAALILVSGISFYGGAIYQKNTASNDRTSAMAMDERTGGMSGQGGMGMMGQRMGGMGTVTAVSDDSITVSLRSFGPGGESGTTSTKTYSISSETEVSIDGESAKVSDIQKGDVVMVRTADRTSTEATQIVVNTSSASGQENTVDTDSVNSI